MTLILMDVDLDKPTYIGCYKDSNISRDLTGLKHISSRNSPEYCTQICLISGNAAPSSGRLIPMKHKILGIRNVTSVLKYFSVVLGLLASISRFDFSS